MNESLTGILSDWDLVAKPTEDAFDWLSDEDMFLMTASDEDITIMAAEYPDEDLWN